MSEEEPAHDPRARVERHHDLGPKSIQRSPQDGALPPISDLGESGTTNQMGVQLEPTHQWIALGEFNFSRLGQAAHPGAQSIWFAFMAARKNAKARHAGSVRDIFDYAGQKRVEILEAAEDA